jgi:large subunit ribosomal protein L13
MTTSKTFSPRPQDIERRWYVVDADGAVLGRLASEVAKVLRGKHKPIFAPHADTGDHVIVVNASKITLTGGKHETKFYHHHSGYPGGLRSIAYGRLMEERPVLVVEKAIRGMLPKNRLGRAMFKKLAVYEGGEHPHQAQQPVALGLGEVPKWDGLPAPKEPKPKAVHKPKAQMAPAKRSTGGAKASTAKRATARNAAAKTSTARSSTAKRSTAKAATAKKAADEAPKRRVRRTKKSEEES